METLEDEIYKSEVGQDCDQPQVESVDEVNSLVSPSQYIVQDDMLQFHKQYSSNQTVRRRKEVKIGLDNSNNAALYNSSTFLAPMPALSETPYKGLITPTPTILNEANRKRTHKGSLESKKSSKNR